VGRKGTKKYDLDNGPASDGPANDGPANDGPANDGLLILFLFCVFLHVWPLMANKALLLLLLFTTPIMLQQ
jgi:hypothetical protein